jgi:hypothetical protein
VIFIVNSFMKVSFFTKNSSKAGIPVFKSMMKAVAETDTVLENSIDADVAVIWSLLWHGKMAANKLIWKEFKKQGKPIVVLEVGGINRNTTWKVGIDGINGRANFCNKENLDVNRPKKLGIELKPWKTNGENIIICGQHQKSEQWINLPHIDQYYENRILEIRNHTDAPIFLREHPRHLRGIHYMNEIDLQLKYAVKYMATNHIEGTYDNYDFNTALENAKLVVSESSNPGMEATINGVPAWTGPESLTYPVSVHPKDLDKEYPDREQWLIELAHTEWTVEEIESGIPWARLLNSLSTYHQSN